jgi:hypothetical protein
LGGITQSAIDLDIGHQRAWFWNDVIKRLDGLANRVSVEDRRRIEAAVAKKVPRPSKEEYDAIVRECREIFGPYWSEPYWSGPDE